MTAKFLLSEDIDRLRELHDGSFILPDRVVCGRVGYHRDTICAFLLAKPTVEGILVIDKNLAKPTRTKLIIELIENVKDDLLNLGHNECHAFVKDADFADFLKKYLAFEDVKGHTLVWHGSL